MLARFSTCLKRSTLRNIPRIPTQSCSFSTDHDDKEHATMTSSQEHKLHAIIDLWDYELQRNNAGAFGMQYILSHPTARIQNTHILKATSLFQQIMGFIAGADGLSAAEIELLRDNQHLLCDYTFTNKLAEQNLQNGAKMSDSDLDVTIQKYLKECGEIERLHLIGGLYMCLCVAGSDGLGEKEVAKYRIVAEKMGFDQTESDKILDTYYLECKLIASFNDLYGIPNTTKPQ